MGKRVRALVWAAVLPASPSAIRGENVSFDFVLESPGRPDFDANPAFDGEAGEEFLFTANLTLSTSGAVEGPQAWTIALWHGGMELVAMSVEGTVSAPRSQGGLVDDNEANSFFIYEIVDPARNDGKQGVVQVVVLSLREIVTLPGNTRQTVGKNLYRARIQERGATAFLLYEDGLVGGGEPIVNVISIRGESFYPSLGYREITTGTGAVPESGNCLDGIDNDGDGWRDGGDPDCRGQVDREACNDGIDNDGDGATDCRDADCLGHPLCPPLEICTDGADNDRDGRTDCDDADCRIHPACRVPEDCDDGIDNDDDRRTDCEDPGCFGVPPCPFPEVCTDGADNDLDGAADCDDDECTGFAICRGRELCRDGVDNDIDGLADCADPDCTGVPPCPPGERCAGGVDDDGDSLVDCEDPSCGGDPACGAAPRGFELVLAAAGAFREDPGPGGGATLTNIVEVPFAAGTSFEATVYLVPYLGPQPSGAQGWSLSIAHDKAGLGFASATIGGTDAEIAHAGGFEVTEGAHAGGGGGAASGRGAGEEEADGFISATVLHLKKGTTLNPTIAQSIARATYVVKEGLGSPGFPAATIRFQDGLEGSGEPIPNVITIGGDSVVPVHRIPLEVRRGVFFLRGDPNDDGKVNIADPIWSLNELLRGGRPSPCRLAGDANGDERHDISDSIYSIQYLFLHGPALAWPFPRCGGPMGEKALPCPVGSVTHCP